ncbi:MAG: histidine phosphatase family protein [Candidatus Nitrosopelagicus sp.]|jgi:probable phosphoglycerate mutase|nr:histidine phosphatase family protein [Candidatus Nitrosopelagicus sp.]
MNDLRKMIIFLRHGQAENNTKKILAGRSPGVNLTETGIEQAEGTGKMLKSLNISKIYSSPIDRAIQTANIVGNHCDLEPVADDRLIELDMGKFTKMPYDQIFAKHGNVFLKFYEGSNEVSENGVETFAQVQKRIFEMVDSVINKHKNENVVLVTHMDPIKAMIGKTLSLKPEILFELIIANASLNIFKNHDQKFYLTGINVMPSVRFHETF